MTRVYRTTEELLQQITLDKLALEDCDLSCFTVNKQDFKGILVRGSKIFSFTFEQVDFRSSIWHWNQLSNVTFRECDMRGSRFLQVSSHELSFDNCAVDGMSFSGSRLNSAFFNKCDGWLNLGESDASGSCFIDCDMQFSLLSDANLSYSVFTDTDLSGSDFTNCLVKSTSFNRCHLTDCNLLKSREPGSAVNYIDCRADPIYRQAKQLRARSVGTQDHSYVEPSRHAKLICSSLQELRSNKPRVAQ